jgi:endonuclease III
VNDRAIATRLVEHGQKLFDAPRERIIPFAGHAEADALTNDLDSYPHAFVLANVMNRQITAEKAWRIPYLVSQKIGGFSMEALSALSREDICKLMSNPPLHRFVEMMSECFYKAVQRIAGQYAGDASRIWKGKPSSAEVVYRFLEFEGVGPKIANLATNDLARRFKIPFADYFSIDVSADVHVRRVFGRLELCPHDSAVEQVVYRARALHPEFPGLIDLATWEIGYNWCKARDPECDTCCMKGLCPTASRTGQ